jgi:hypothetical protein
VEEKVRTTKMEIHVRITELEVAKEPLVVI